MSEELSVREIRLQKLARMRELGHDPFEVEKFDRTGTATELKKRFDGVTDVEELKTQPITFAGRVVSYRDMGKAGFAHVSDGDDKIQVYVRKDEVGEVGWELYQLLDIGDHVGIRGHLFRTKTDEPSIWVHDLVPISKCLEVLPLGKEKDGTQWYGLADVEHRYRHRHLDLICNFAARKALVDRSKIVSAVRQYFDGSGYLEVETPLLQVVAGGAAARPFTTHYNHYDMEVKLRISLELYLKRLICGDLPAVYEIGRVFRNEGVSNRHNPEFSLLEFYEAYTNLESMMRRVEKLFAFVAKKVYDTTLFVCWGKSLKPARIINGNLTWESGLIFENLPQWADCTEQMMPPFFIESRPDYGDSLDQVIEIHHGSYSFFGLKVSNSGAGIDVFAKTAQHCVLRSTEGLTLSFKSGVVSIPPNSLVRIRRFPGEETSESVKGKIAEIYTVDFSESWAKIDLIDEIRKHTGLTRLELSSFKRCVSAIKRRKIVEKANALGSLIDVNKEDNLGGLIEKLLEVFIEPTLQKPTFVVGYPIEVSPLAKKVPGNPRMTRRFEGYILGREICNAFSEINDPIDQKERFEMQAEFLAGGDDEAHPYDEEFLYALECGMPPTGGCGMGMERLAMVFTGSEHIREVMLFPMMKPEAKVNHEGSE